MAGISLYGAYIPFHRLKREEISRAWEGGPLKGEKAVASYDEDSITMAVEAGTDCLKGIDRNIIDGLYFASTTAPYKEKQSAALIATVLDLRRDVLTVDFSNSLRAGTNAVKVAMDAVESGSAKNILVIASDCRMGTPGTEFEQVFGDGAAALVINKEGSIAIEDSYTHAEEILDVWKTEGQNFVKTWEDRFVITQGYLGNVQEALSVAAKKFNVDLKNDFNKVIFYAPDERRHQEASKMLKLDIKNQLQPSLFGTVGNTGCAYALMMLVAAIEEAKEGDRLLLVNYGDGCDIFSLRVKGKTENKGRRGIKGYLASKMLITNYERYVRLRKLMNVETGRRRPPAISSAAVLYRDRKMVLSLKGSRCKNCGREFFPPQRVCNYCQAKDQFEMVRLAERKGTLFTFCKDFVATAADPPLVVSIVDLEGNVRIYGQMTDRDLDKIEMDMPVEMTFRKMNEAEGILNYFWKCRPVR